jgi:Tol biopolymer transport system component
MIVATLGILEGCQEKETVDVSAKPDRELTPDNSLLSRLSGKIAFQSDRDGDWDIYVMNADGSDSGFMGLDDWKKSDRRGIDRIDLSY